MKDMRVPGVVWAILIIVVIAITHENEVWIQMNWGIEPYLIDILVGILVAVLKTLSLGTEQLNQALDIIDRILANRRTEREEMRGIGTTLVDEAIPERPNPVMRWLVG